MNIEPPVNQNYCATIVRPKALLPLEGCDRLLGVPLFGYQAIVGIDTDPNALAVVFPAEVQLSEDFCRMNNLHRHADLNEDPGKAGYLEDNRRVRSLKLRGHRSDCLFMPIDSLKYTGVDVSELQLGMEFDHLGGVEICKKYTVKRRQSGPKQTPRRTRTDTKFFPEHFDTTNYFKMEPTLDLYLDVTVTQKLHGTSVRIGNSLVERKLTIRDRIAGIFGVKAATTEYAMIYGSRKVIKDPNEPGQAHYYDSDIWTQVGKRLDGLIPEGFVVYGEIVGFTEGNSPIQANYTYNCEPGTCKLYIYRVTTVNPKGVLCDLSWDAVKEFCVQAGVDHVPELMRSKLYNVKAAMENFIDTDLWSHWSGAIKLSKDSVCDEGVCIRAEGIIPRIWKAKSPKFLAHETKMLDEAAVDMEEDAA